MKLSVVRIALAVAGLAMLVLLTLYLVGLQDPSRIWVKATGMFNSQFISAFLSSLAGAGFGVWGAQRVTERTARRKELQDALRQANALLVLATTIANQSLGLKNQQVAAMVKKFFDSRPEAELMNEKLINGEAWTVPFHFNADMTHITPITAPVDGVKSLAYSAHLIPGKALALVAMIDASSVEHAQALKIREAQIDMFKKSSLTTVEFVRAYYGLKGPDGIIDSIYHDSLIAIDAYTNDVAFFSAELAEEIQLHGANIAAKLNAITGGNERAGSVDFSEARSSGLLPPREDYEGWLKGFRGQG